MVEETIMISIHQQFFYQIVLLLSYVWESWQLDNKNTWHLPIFSPFEVAPSILKCTITLSDFPEISSISDETSITLTWEQEDHNNEINYFVTYKVNTEVLNRLILTLFIFQANDICLSEPHNLKRVKSNGFLWTKVNEITIPDLVPYTLYNVTVETVLHQNVRSKMINTLETGE